MPQVKGIKMPKPVPLSGRLEENSLPKLLNYINELKNSGTLAVSRDSIEKRLFIKDGSIIFASSNYEGDRLGELLLKAGKITVSQFDTAVKVLKQSDKRMGGILVELGYIKPKDLFWGVKYQVQEIICSLFAWTEGSYEFRAGELPQTEVITLHMSSANLIMQGIKRIDDWTRISRGIPDMDAVLVMTSDPMKLYQDVDISEDEKKVLSLFDGKRSIKDVFAQSKVGDFEALKAVYLFYTIGMLVQAGSQTAAKPGKAAKAEPQPPNPDASAKEAVHKAYLDSMSQDYYELLGIDSEADAGEIEAACQRLAKQYHPDNQFRKGFEKMRGELEHLFNKVTEAREILTDDSRRWEYDLSLATVLSDKSSPSVKRYTRSKDPAKAKEAYLKGIESFKARDFESATVHFKEATRQDTTNALYFSNLALALLQRPRREAEAEEAMLAAIELEPDTAEHRSNLGLLYQKAGIKDKAKEAFETALRLDPANQKALKALGKK
jgi:curved DNA-binding protein CbpA